MLSDPDRKALYPILRDIPLFSSLDETGLDNLLESAVRRDYEPETTICKEGERDRTFFLILNGAVEVRKGRKVLAQLETGQFFGEMALLYNQARSADVVAIDDTACALLSSKELSRIIAGSPRMRLRHKEGL